MFALHHLYSYSSKYENVTKQMKISVTKNFTDELRKLKILYQLPLNMS